MADSYDVSQQPKQVGMGLPLGMMVAGGGLGYVSNDVWKRKMTPEELDKMFQSNDTVEFSSKVDEDLIAKAKQAKVELDEAKKNVLDPSCKEARDWDDIQKQAESKIRQLNAQEEKRAGKTVGKGFPKAADIPAWDKLTGEQIPTDLVDKKGNPLNNAQVKAEYEKLVRNLTTEEGNIASIVNPIKTSRDIARTELEKIMNDISTACKTKKPEQVDAYFDNLTTRNAQFKNVLTHVQSVYPTPTALTNEQLMEIGTEVSKAEYQHPPKGYSSFTVPEKNAIGNMTDRYFIVENKEKSKKLKEVQKALADDRQVMAEDIFREMRNTCEINAEKKALRTVFAEDVKTIIGPETLERTGLYNTSTYKLNLAEIISVDKADYSADLKTLQAWKGKRKTNPAEPFPSLKGHYDSLPENESALSALRARIAVNNEYVKKESEITQRLNASIEGNRTMIELNERIAKVYEDTEAVQKAREALAEKFPGVAQFDEVVETESKKTFAFEDLDQAFKDRFNKIKADYEKIASEKGKPDPKKIEGAQTKYNEALKALSEKAKLPRFFKNKWAAPAIGAGVLLLAGLGIRGSKNKQA